MRPVDLWATGLALLCIWGVYATGRTLRRSSNWSWKRKWALLVDILFSGSCAMCAVSLGSQWFRAWMVAPLGASYLLMIPMPCYFESVNHIRWLHTTRNILFVATAVGCFAVATGLIPLSWLGI
jgi:hypothetical protein